MNNTRTGLMAGAILSVLFTSLFGAATGAIGCERVTQDDSFTQATTFRSCWIGDKVEINLGRQ